MWRIFEADLKFLAILGCVVVSSIGISDLVAAQRIRPAVSGIASDDLASEYDTLPESTWKSIGQICEMVHARHINPPAKQQMILAGAKAMYFANEKRPPSDLASQVSAKTTDSEFRQFLDSHWKKSLGDSQIAVGQVDQMILAGIARSFDYRATIIPPKALRVEKQLAENRYVGIGIRLVFENGFAVISDPIIGGAARKAGSRPGDIILEIDGKTAKGMNLGQVVDRLRGDRGTKVSVKVRNQHSGKIHTMQMVRDKVPIPTVHGARRNEDDSWNYRIKSDRKLAYLRFDRIVGSTAAEVKTLAAEIDEQGFKHVVLDLRVGSSIELHHAMMLADSLAAKHDLGKLSTATRDRTLSTREDHCLKNKKVYVIANQSVSGAELVVLTALRLSGAVFVGRPIASDGNVGERIDISANIGAVSDVSTSVFRAFPNHKTSRNADSNRAVAFSSFGAVLLEPDHPVSLDSAVDKCIELFDKELKGIRP